MRRVASALFARRLAPVGLSCSVFRAAARHQGGGVPPRGPMGTGNVPPSPLSAQSPGEEPDVEMPPPVKPEGPKMLQVETDAKGITTLRLARAPVNSLNLEFFDELISWMQWLGYDAETKAVVLTSAIPSVFSAGLDINELYQPSPERMAKFWQQFQYTWMILNSFPKPLIAAINGNSPAGGCILALGCDYRIMVRSPAGKPERAYRIGLNETKLGLVAPPWVMAGYSYVLGQRKAERMLQLGETPTADEALALGLVDAVVEDDAALVTQATREAERFLAIPSQARSMARDMMRREILQLLDSEEAASYDVEFFMNYCQHEEVQSNIGKYLALLGGGAKRK